MIGLNDRTTLMLFPILFEHPYLLTWTIELDMKEERRKRKYNNNIPSHIISLLYFLRNDIRMRMRMKFLPSSSIHVLSPFFSNPNSLFKIKFLFPFFLPFRDRARAMASFPFLSLSFNPTITLNRK